MNLPRHSLQRVAALLLSLLLTTSQVVCGSEVTAESAVLSSDAASAQLPSTAPTVRPDGAPTNQPGDAPTKQQLAFFESRVRPLLAEHCYECHSGRSKKLQASLRVDSRAGLLAGGESGPAIEPGSADTSPLIEAVRYESYEMPPQGKLPAEAIETLARWVEMGAPWPLEKAPESTISQPRFDLEQRKTQHWSWQPILNPPVPGVADQQWPLDPMDHFVLARLEAEQLHPSADTDRAALVRRLSFDLLGLPPTPQQTADFVHDEAPQATERLVDSLLRSPHFGERWGRHWLDLVRYAESRGHEFDNDSPNAFQYRDYIIRALNADVPYDRLVEEHIAGDLLATPRLNPEHGFNESVLGTGFWFLGEWVHSPVDIRKDEADRFDNMIDVMSKSFLGVTVACARCHDHKFDAISTADYYSLSGFLQSSDYRQVRFESLEQNRRVARSLATVDAKYRALITEQLAREGVQVPSPAPLDDAFAQCVVVDYADVDPDEYLQDGFLFGSHPSHAGQAQLELVAGEPTIRFARDAAAASDPFWNGLEALAEKGVRNQSKLAEIPRSGRTLRTPTFDLTNGKVACHVRGRGHVIACVDSHRLVAGPLHGETIQTIDTDGGWVTLNLNRYVGHRLHLEFTPAQDAQLAVSRVTQGASSEAFELFDRWEKMQAAKQATFAAAANRVLAQRLPKLAVAWAEERASLQPQVMRHSQLAMAMMDGTGEEDHVLIRGNTSQPGAVEPRHFLTAITGDQPLSIPYGSGRLELARQINAPTNPLTSRVIVNRIWHYLMGRGIVPTTDDFGVLGQQPTHPALLDHLATRFNNNGRSLKQMIRAIVLSRTYQMSSYADVEAVSRDPKNRLWHHRPPKRLEGEVIRDALLAISGRLDDTMFGEPIPIHLTDFMEGRGRPPQSGPLDGDGRRSIYIAVRRNFLSPFMLTFDTPAPFSTMGRRNVSNVPAQALIVMNDPLVVELAGQWAERGIELHAAADARIEWMYQTALARQPTEQEKAIALRYLSAEAALRGTEQADSQLWADLAHALINTKEFIYLR